MNEVAAQSDVFLPGIAEAKILCGLQEPEAIAAHYLAAGAKLVVVKLGGKGAYYARKGEAGFVPGYTVKKVVDTVGAGDGFAAGLLSGLMEGLPLQSAVLRGNAIGAIQVMSRGDNDGPAHPRAAGRLYEGGRASCMKCFARFLKLALCRCGAERRRGRRAPCQGPVRRRHPHGRGNLPHRCRGRPASPPCGRRCPRCWWAQALF